MESNLADGIELFGKGWPVVGSEIIPKAVGSKTPCYIAAVGMVVVVVDWLGCAIRSTLK